MRALATVIFLSLIMMVPHGRASAQSFDDIAESIRKGNAPGLSKYFAANVEINIKDAQNSYSKSQGEAVLKNFFGAHIPKTFTIVHQGQSPEGAKYFIGTLCTSAGTFRTYVYAKQASAGFVIQEVRFEAQ
jgi:hypothetical protein